MKKQISIVLIITILIMGLSGCGAETDATLSDKQPGTVMEETDETITIVDQARREVTVKKNVKSIALCYRVVIRFLLSLDQGEKIKGIGKTEDFLYKLEPSLKQCKDVGKGVADIEALAELKPDVFFHKAGDRKTLDAVEEIGIPAIGIDIETPHAVRQAIDIMGKVCDAEEEAKKQIDYYDRQLFLSKKKVKKLKDKKTAIMMGSSLGSVADESMLQGEMIKRAGGINMARGIKVTELWPTVGVEQIFQWDPDFIFITNSESANYTAEDILKNPAWSQLKAVKAKHVYGMPAEEDSWEFPGTASTLGIDYMMHKMYPELMSNKELEENINHFYKFAYGKSFSKKQLGY